MADSTSTRRIWQDIAEDVQKEIFKQRKVVVSIERNGKRRNFIARSPKFDPANPPWSLARELGALDDVLTAILHEPLPAFPLLTLDHLLKAWDAFGSFTRLALAEIGQNTNAKTLESLLRFSLPIKRQEMEKILRLCVTDKPDTIKAVIEFLTYAPRSVNFGGLWARPFIKGNEETFYVAAPPLLTGNLLRCVEFWMRLGKVNFDERGRAYEKLVRSDLVEDAKTSERLSNISVYPEQLNLKGEQIDLIFRIGSTILVGEIKYHVFPVDPLEMHNYQVGTLDEAIAQVLRKASAVSSESAAVQNLLGLPVELGKVLKVVPFVLTNLAIGAGASRCGVPILDTRYLSNYIRKGTANFLTTVEPNGDISSKLQHKLYADEEDAEKDCAEHFMNQPTFLLYAKHAKPALRWLLTSNDRAAAFVYYAVDLDPLMQKIGNYPATP